MRIFERNIIMKKLLQLLCSFIILVSCSKEPSTIIWKTINFKTHYTIQVPDGFEGLGMTGFEGNIFEKYSTDNKIILSYDYPNGGTFFYDFGDTLPNPHPNYIMIKDYSNNLVTLNHIEMFNHNLDTIGILYYSKDSICNGRLYWRDNGYVKQALDLKFILSEFNVVEQIINSIKEK